MERGHRLQLIVTNAQFPMIWPTPFAMSTKLFLGEGASSVTVPFVGSRGNPAELLLKVPTEPEPTPPGFAELGGALGPAPVPVVSRDGSVVHARQHEAESFKIGELIFEDEEEADYSVDERDPAEAGFEGEGHASIKGGGHDIVVSSKISVRSDATKFHVEITRAVRSNGELLRQMTWREDFPRDLQ
jgi:hypothetical protein